MELEVFLFPVLLFCFFIYIKQRVILPEFASLTVYMCISVYLMRIYPVYGVVSALIFILYDNIEKNAGKEGMEQMEQMEQMEEGFFTEIPKTIYQTWHSRTLPQKMADCVERLKKDNPEFEHHLYDDAECRAFISENFDESVVDAYDALIPGAFKADLWRYCVLYKKGGVYLDIKFQCEPGFSLKKFIKENTYIREYNNKGTGLYEHIVYTGCISSRPNNPIFMKCIRKIVDNVRNKYYGPEHTSPTGPYLFASMMEPEDIENCEYAYYEKGGVGFIRHIENKTVIMSHYPEYRNEQRSNHKSSYWKDAWINREIYRSTASLDMG